MKVRALQSMPKIYIKKKEGKKKQQLTDWLTDWRHMVYVPNEVPVAQCAPIRPFPLLGHNNQRTVFWYVPRSRSRLNRSCIESSFSRAANTLHISVSAAATNNNNNNSRRNNNNNQSWAAAAQPPLSSPTASQPLWWLALFQLQSQSQSLIVERFLSPKVVA